jgi:hypothetical protein
MAEVPVTFTYEKMHAVLRDEANSKFPPTRSIVQHQSYATPASRNQSEDKPDVATVVDDVDTVGDEAVDAVMVMVMAVEANDNQ